MLPFIAQANNHLNKIAILSDGKEYTYDQLLKSATLLASKILGNHTDLNEARVAFMVNPGFDYVKTLWAIWQAGRVAVPLCITHPLPSLEYVLEDTGAHLIVLSKEYEIVLQPYLEKNKTTIIFV